VELAEFVLLELRVKMWMVTVGPRLATGDRECDDVINLGWS